MISLGAARRGFLLSQGKGGEASSYVAKLVSHNSSQLTIHDSVSKSLLSVYHSPPDVRSSEIPVSNKFSYLDLADAGILFRFSPEARMATNKRYHCSTDSVDLRSVPPTKISAIPTPRLQSVDKMSSLSAGDSASSSKPICSTSLCLAVPSATGEAVDCEDTPLVDDAMHCHLDRQMF